MKILIAGYGNIGRAVDTLIRSSRKTTVSSIEIIEKKVHGINVQQWLAKNHKSVDVVLNLTGELCEYLLHFCQQNGLDYIDTGLELEEDDNRTLFEAFRQLRVTPSNIKALIGFGMNPGIIEYIYYQSAPQKKHMAIELEYDTASRTKEGVFTTWSPVSYFLESMIYVPYFYTPEKTWLFRPPANSIEVKLDIDGIYRTFDLTPHEEVISMGSSNRNCRFCAFLYQPPVVMQQYLKSQGHRLCPDAVRDIPTLGDGISGDDIIGILINDYSESLPYHFNRASHSICSAYFKDRDGNGINATSYQVACGVMVALELLPHLNAGIYTMTDVADKFSNLIEKVLSDLNFNVEQRTFDSVSLRWDNMERVIKNTKLQSSAESLNANTTRMAMT